MKLLVVINSLATGGAEKLVLDTVPYFIEKGMDVEVLLLNGDTHPFLEQLRMVENCTIHSLGTGSVYNPFLLFRIPKYMRGIDIAHVHLFPSLYWVALSRLFSNHKPKLIFTEHSTTNRRRNWFFKALDRWVYSKYKRIVLISEEVKEALSEHLRLPPGKYTVIKNGIDLSAFENSEGNLNEFSDGPNDRIMVQVSRFYYPKDQKTVIRSLQHLPEYYKLVLVGDGDKKPECEELVSDLGLTDRVHFTGVRTDIPNILKAADFVVLSSAYEGQSLAAIEGMASGNPFIASEVPGLKEMTDGYGMVFPFGDETALANTILRLANDQELNAKIIEACQARASQFDIRNSVDQYIQLYTEVFDE